MKTSPSEAAARASAIHAPGWLPGVRPFPEVQLGEPVFGFTILEPFASAIVHGPKRIENRSNPPPDRLQARPFWILVHTGARIYPGVTREDFQRPHRDRMTGERRMLWPACPPFAAFEPRAIIGAARVVGYAWDEDARSIALDDWSVEGQCHWILDPTTIALPEPFPWPVGELGLWAPKRSTTPEAQKTEKERRRDVLAEAFLRARDAVRRAMPDPKNHRRAS